MDIRWLTSSNIHFIGEFRTPRAIYIKMLLKTFYTTGCPFFLHTYPLSIALPAGESEDQKPSESLDSVVREPLLVNLTRDILDT